MRVLAALLLVFVSFAGCSGGGGGGGGGNETVSSSVSFPPITPAPPKASPYVTIRFSPTTPAPGDEVTFNVTYTRPDHVAVSYDWDFGDTGNSTEASPTHVFSAVTAGTGTCKDKGYSVSVDVVDDSDLTLLGLTCVPVKIRLPTVSFTLAPETPAPGDSVLFSATALDPDGTVTSYDWEFGDGVAGSGREVAHVFRAPSGAANAICKNGGYNVTLAVTDDDGGRATAKQCVVVQVRAPVVSFNFTPAAPKINQEVQFNGVINDADGTIQSKLWDFGDGSTSTELSPKHTFKAPGTQTTAPCSKTAGYIVKLTAKDDDGGVGTLSKCVVVTT